MARNKRIRAVSIIIAVLLLALFVSYQMGFFGTGENGPAAPTAKGPAETAVIPVKAQLINFEDLSDNIIVSGATLSNEDVEVNSEVAGKVSKIYFTEGGWVKKGEPLVKLDDDEFRAQRYRLEVSRELTANIAARFKGLYEKEGVSLQEYEIAEAEAEQVKAEIALLEAQLSKRTILAPFSGRLGLRLVSEGSFLAPGTPIVRLVNTDPIKLEFSVPEKYSNQVGKGSKVQFRLDGFPDERTATVEASDPVIDPATRSLRLKANAPNPGGRILPGAFASVTVNLSKQKDAIMVPTEAIVPEMGGKKVYVYRAGKAQPVSVETGIRKDATIQITGGLQNGDTVITSGVMQIRPGSEVRITELDQAE